MISKPREKTVLKRTVVLLAIVLAILIVGGIKIVTVSIMASAPLAHLTVVSGEVLLSDGMKEVDAKNGNIFGRDVRILLKTGEGVAKLRLRDGSYVIMGANSMIELNRQKETNPENFFVFNLITGKVMVISEKGSRKPVQFLIRNNVVVRGFQAILGAEAPDGRGARVNIDCMVGLCQVNGIHLIISGQKAEVRPDNTLLIVDNVSFADWISLGVASGFVFDFPQLQAQVDLTSIPMVFLTIAPLGGYQNVPVTGDFLSTPSPSSTTGILPTATVTPVPTRTLFLRSSRTPASTPTHSDRDGPPASTPRPSLSPSGTFTTGTTPSPSMTAALIPTDTETLQPSSTLTSTNEPTLAPAPTFTPAHSPTPTPRPSATPRPSPTPRPTHTPKPTHTQVPIPTETIANSPVPTNTPEPVPSDTPVAVDSPVPAETPIPVDTPVPTHTPDDDDDD